LNFSKIYNPMMKALLRSPLHGMVSNGIMLITFHGRKSGKVHSTPVNYLREGNNITVFSRRDRVWWRNLRGGAEVTVLSSLVEILEEKGIITQEEYEKRIKEKVKIK